MSAEMQREREMFSNWAETLDMDMALIVVDGQEIYSDCNTDYAWQAWQAARRDALKDAAKVVMDLPLKEVFGEYPYFTGECKAFAITANSAILSLSAAPSGEVKE